MINKLEKQVKPLSKLLWLFALTVLICSCVSSPKQPRGEMIATLDLSPEIEELRQHKDTLFFQVGIIPGKLYGNPKLTPLWNTDLQELSTFDLLSYEVQMDKYVEPHDSSHPLNQFTLTPLDTKFVRLSTFGFNKKNKGRISSGGKDEYGNYIALVYFDRACSITGLTSSGARNVEHDIHIPSKGLYQILFKGDGNNMAASAIQSPQKMRIFMSNDL